MDPELIAYLDERFRETSRQIQELREETSQQFQGLREETSQQFQGLREETSQQFQDLREETSQQFLGLREETSQQILGLQEETSQRFNKVNERFDQMDEQLRLTDVKVEGLRDHIKQVAEGVAAGNESLSSFKKDVAKEFSDTKALIKDGYKELDRRVRVLELRASIPQS